MNDIERMARNAGLFVPQAGIPENGALTRFAALVRDDERERIIAQNAPEIEKINAHIKALEEAVAAEREACAKVCESLFDADDDTCDEAEKCAAAIRARSTPPAAPGLRPCDCGRGGFCSRCMP